MFLDNEAVVMIVLNVEDMYERIQDILVELGFVVGNFVLVDDFLDETED